MSFYEKNKEYLKHRAKSRYYKNRELILEQTRIRNINSYFPHLSKDEALIEIDKLLKKQNYVCAICLRPEKRKGAKNLSIDHCHKTNKVRGLLCFECNTTLGKLERYFDKICVYIGKRDV